ncbi:protein phosphatase PrpC [Clostridia bacterium]|nr:protein phosphatase PrpC [Clostridia bacterium]
MLAWGATDKGVVRQQNQDAFKLDAERKGERPPRPVFVVVCDGMGGASAGNVASDIAVKTAFEVITRVITPRMSPRQMRLALEEAVAEANTAVCGYAEAHPECFGMGTTLVTALVSDGLAVLANVGDSRAYKISNDGEISRETIDHSLVSDLVRLGELTEEQARNHPRKNYITRALGTEESVKCDIFEVKLNAGEFLLLCSDGLTNMLGDKEILYEVIHGGEHAGACRRLIAAANHRGGHDNITVALLSM